MHDPLRARFGSLLSQAARYWRRALDRRLQPYGLTEATWLPLIRLARADTPMRQKDLAASLGLDGSSVVRLLDALQAAGLIERREEGSDRRAKTIVLTAQGQATVDQVECIAQQVRDEALQDIPAEDIRLTFDTLERICGRIGPDDQDSAP